MDLKRMEGALEPTLKLLGALGVLLYVLGLIVSNLHLMELGISEFASFNLRNATTGFIFIAWIGLILILVAPGSLFLVLTVATLGANFRLRKKLAVIAIALLLSTLLTAAVLEAVGRVIRYAYAWGAPWQFIETPGSLMDFLTMKSTREGLGFAYAGFGHVKAIVAGIGLMALLAMFGFRPAIRWLAAKTRIGFDPDSIKQDMKEIHVSIAATFPILLLMLMSAFSVHVLPNIRGNVGGHQPQIALLGLREEESRNLGFQAGGEIAIWHQTDKFLYLTPLSSPATGARGERQDLVALDISLVKTVRYLHRYARVTDGARIVEVGVPPGG